jgi:hypothetical protein
MGRPPLAAQDRKVVVALRLPRLVVEQFRATGPGWQSRMRLLLVMGAAFLHESGHVKRSRRRAASSSHTKE